MKLRFALLLLVLFLAACSGGKPSGSGSSKGGYAGALLSGRLSVQLPDGYVVGSARDWPVDGQAWVPGPGRGGSTFSSARGAGFGADESAASFEWIVGVTPWMEADELAARIAPLGARLVRKLYGSDAYLIRFDTPQPADSPEVEELLGIPGVIYAEPNGIVRALAVHLPNDPYFEGQTNLEMIGAAEAWGQLADMRGGAGTGGFHPVEVAIVDTGVCPQHPDLPGLDSWSGLKSFLPPYPNAVQCEGDTHGTEVASVLLAVTNNGIGIAGTFAQELWARGTLLRPTAVKVLDDGGKGGVAAVAEALNWLADERRAKVVNLSLGGRESSRDLEAAVRNAAGAGLLLVAAAGNMGTGGDCRGICYPAAYEDVIAVGSVNPTGERSSFSAIGPQLDLVAPGGGVWVARSLSGHSHDYAVKSGTSYAAPAVSAAAAMLVAAGLDDPRAIKDVLLFTARSIRGYYDKFRQGHSDEYGWGLLDAGAALALRNRPVVFVARESPDGTRLTPASAVVWPTPDGLFRLDAFAANEDDLYLVGWVDADRDGAISAGDYFAKEAVRREAQTASVLDLVAHRYQGPRIEVR